MVLTPSQEKSYKVPLTLGGAQLEGTVACLGRKLYP